MFLLVWNPKFYLLLDSTLVKAFCLHYDFLVQSRSSELLSIWHSCFKSHSCKLSLFGRTSDQGHPSLCESPSLQLACCQQKLKEKSTPKGSMLPLYEREIFHRRQHVIPAALLSSNAHLSCLCLAMRAEIWRYLLLVLVHRLSLCYSRTTCRYIELSLKLTITIVPSM